MLKLRVIVYDFKGEGMCADDMTPSDQAKHPRDVQEGRLINQDANVRLIPSHALFVECGSRRL